MRPFSVRTTLALVVLLALLPPLVVGGIALERVWAQQRSELGRQLLQSVTALAAGLSRELHGSRRRLELLASAALPRGPDDDRLFALSEEVLRTSPEWQNIVLYDAGREQVFNVRAQRNGEPLLAASDADVPPHRAIAIASASAVISDSFPGRNSRQPLVTIAVPVTAPAGRSRLLEASIDPDYLNQLFDPKSFDANGIGSVVDRNGVIVARTRDADRWIGQRASEAFFARVRSSDSGVVPSTTLDGVRSLTAWARVPDVGWTVIVGLPVAPAEAVLRRNVLGLAAVGLLTFALSALVAWYVGREMATGVERSAHGAAALASGEPPAPATYRLKELAALQQALLDAHARLQAVMAERDASEAERERLYGEERTARALAEQANRAKDEFLAMLAHELRNPLAAVSNATGILAHAEERPETVAFARDILARQTGNLVRLVDDLLDVGRLITGKVRFEPQAVDFGALVDRTTANARLDLGDRTRTLACRTEPGLLVHGDPTRLEQIASNLIGNAIRYTPTDGRIEVTAVRDGDTAVLAVKDDGYGIAPALLPIIFDLFVQGERTLDRSAGGLGIGLTVVKRLAELHGGTVSAHSPGPDQGATFVVRLPLSQPLEQQRKG